MKVKTGKTRNIRTFFKLGNLNPSLLKYKIFFKIEARTFRVPKYRVIFHSVFSTFRAQKISSWNMKARNMGQENSIFGNVRNYLIFELESSISNITHIFGTAIFIFSRLGSKVVEVTSYYTTYNTLLVLLLLLMVLLLILWRYSHFTIFIYQYTFDMVDTLSFCIIQIQITLCSMDLHMKDVNMWHWPFTWCYFQDTLSPCRILQ